MSYFVVFAGYHRRHAAVPLCAPQLVSEQHVLDLERKAFVRLCGERKTRERTAHTLKTGIPLRN